jgi:hypothetical protein
VSDGQFDQERRERIAAGLSAGWRKRTRADGMNEWEAPVQTACSGCGMDDEPIGGGHLERGRYVTGLCSYCKALQAERRLHPLAARTASITRRERAVAVTAIALMVGGVLALILGAMSAALAVVIGALAVLAFGSGMSFGLIFAADRSTSV